MSDPPPHAASTDGATAEPFAVHGDCQSNRLGHVAVGALQDAVQQCEQLRVLAGRKAGSRHGWITGQPP